VKQNFILKHLNIIIILIILSPCFIYFVYLPLDAWYDMKYRRAEERSERVEKKTNDQPDDSNNE